MVVGVPARARALRAFLTRYFELLSRELLAPLVVRLYDLAHFFHSRLDTVRIELSDAHRFTCPRAFVRRRPQRTDTGSAREAHQKAAAVKRLIQHAHLLSFMNNSGNVFLNSFWSGMSSPRIYP